MFGPLSRLFSQEIGPRQQHVMTENRPAPRPAIAHLRTVMAGPQLGQDMAGSGIVGKPAGMDGLHAQGFKGVSDQAMRRLGGLAENPERLAQPIAEFIAIFEVTARHAPEAT